MTGKIMRGVGGFYYVYVEGRGLYECRAKGIFRSRGLKPGVGDVVDIDPISEEEKTGNLVKIHPRKNFLIRPMAANVDQALVIFSVHEPEPDLHLLNRFLIMMIKQEIPVIIGFNKMDLAKAGDQESLWEMYRGSGCRVLFFSAEHNQGISELRGLLQGRTTVMAGPSGVGKSSALNVVSEEKRMETGKISEKIKRGRHTTRHAELIFLAKNTFLLDTPGFSSLYLEAMEKEELRFYFPEFSPYENQCRFHGCVHIHEPDCLVKQAVENGEISRSRYDDYCLFYEELAQIKKW